MHRQVNEAKLRELILYIAKRSEGDLHFGAVKLNKILFYADFIAYGASGEPITGVEYQKLEHGPAPRRVKPLVQEMESAGDCAIQEREHFGHGQKRLIALREPDLDQLTSADLDHVETVLRALEGRNSAEVSDLTHHLHGWQVAAEGETIPYEAVFLGQREPSPAEIDYGGALAAELGV